MANGVSPRTSSVGVPMLPDAGSATDSQFSGIRRPLTGSFVVSLTIQTANIITGILLARVLGPHDRGALAAVILWPTVLATVGSLGLPDAVTFYAARASVPRRTLLGTTLAISSVQSVAMILVGILVIPLALNHFEAGSVRLALIFLAIIPLNLITVALMGMLNGLQHFTAFHVLRATVILLTLAMIVLLAVVGSLTPKTAAAAYLTANAATLLLAVILVARAGEFILAMSVPMGKDLVSFGLKSHTSSLSSMFGERLDQLVISIVLAPAALGLYVVAVTLTSLINLIGSSVAMVALPVLASLRSASEQTAVARRLIVLTLGSSIFVAVPMIAFVPQLIELFFGRAFQTAEGPARILLGAVVLLSTSRALSAVLKAIGRPLQAGLADAIALVVTVATLAALLPLLGLVGAAVSSLLAYGVGLVWMVNRTAGALGVRRSRLFVSAGGFRGFAAAVGGRAANGESR